MVFTLATYALTCICRGHTGRGRHKCPNHAACLHGDRPDTCPSTARRPLPREASANVVKPLSRDVHSLTPRPRAGIYRALQRLPVHPTSTHQRKKQIKGIMRELTPLIVINDSYLRVTTGRLSTFSSVFLCLSVSFYLSVCEASKLRSLPFTHPIYVASRYFQ